MWGYVMPLEYFSCVCLLKNSIGINLCINFVKNASFYLDYNFMTLEYVYLYLEGILITKAKSMRYHKNTELWETS